MGFNTDYRLIPVKSIVEYSKQLYQFMIFNDNARSGVVCHGHFISSAIFVKKTTLLTTFISKSSLCILIDMFG